MPISRCSGEPTRNSPPKDHHAWPPRLCSGSCSRRMTRLPESATSAAATSPARPAPTTMTSASMPEACPVHQRQRNPCGDESRHPAVGARVSARTRGGRLGRMAVTTSTIDIPTPDGTADAFIAYPADGQQHPGVLLFMDAYGLRQRIFDMSQRIAEAGYFVVAPNLF